MTKRYTPTFEEMHDSVKRTNTLQKRGYVRHPLQESPEKIEMRALKRKVANFMKKGMA